MTAAVAVVRIATKASIFTIAESFAPNVLTIAKSRRASRRSHARGATGSFGGCACCRGHVVLYLCRLARLATNKIALRHLWFCAKLALSVIVSQLVPC